MKKIIILCTLIFCSAAVARTINWYVDGSVYQTTTCNSGDGITPPTAPAKYGYTFQEWNTAYTPIEYLESTGTQYIDAELNFPRGFIAETSFEITDMTSSCLFGSWDDKNRNFLWLYNNGVLQVAAGDGGLSYTVSNLTSRKNYIISNTIHPYLKIFGVKQEETVNTISYFYNNLSFYIFARNNKGTAQFFASMKMYNLKLYHDSILVRNFIPVLDKNGTPCMYDKVSGTFFYNAGTGNFIAGPVISE